MASSAFGKDLENTVNKKEFIFQIPFMKMVITRSICKSGVTINCSNNLNQNKLGNKNSLVINTGVARKIGSNFKLKFR
jgi:hypothetical protein